MLNFNINLSSLAMILWSGMLIITGSIWVLASQVRKLSDILEEQARRANAVDAGPAITARRARPYPPSLPSRRRVVASLRVVRGSIARAQLTYAAMAAASSNLIAEQGREDERLAS